MEKVRHCSNLLDRAVEDVACLMDRSAVAVRRWPEDHSIQHHLGRGKVLPDAVMQVACKSSALFVLRSQQPARKPAQFHIQTLQLHVLAIELREYADLRPQEFGNYRNRNVID